MLRKRGFGMVFSGGGGKGAYEIGVWKALLETKQFKIEAVSGTSVGALNAALYATCDYKKAESIWLNINNDKILTPDEHKFNRFFGMFVAGLITRHTIDNAALMKMGASVFARRYLSSREGLFSRQGLDEIIRESKIPSLLRRAEMPCYATCYNLREWRTQYFQLNTLTEEQIVSVLLASSAIPVIFPKEVVNNNCYCDGGIPIVGDNIPVLPLYEAGWRKILVVHLNRDGVDKIQRKYKGCEFIHIFPGKSPGGALNGTLDFSPQGIRKRIEQGYMDMKRQIQMLGNIDKLLEEREENAEEIHIYAGKYYNSMDSVLQSCKRDVEGWGEARITEDTDFRFTDMDKELSEVCKKLSKNKDAMNDFVLKGITAISAADAQYDEKTNAGFFKRLLGGITGKNRRLQEGIDKNLINSQRATLKMIAQLLESDNMTVELLQAVQSQLQCSTVAMSKILEAHGVEITKIRGNISEIAKQYNTLVEKNTEFESEIAEIYEIIEDKTSHLEARLTEYRDELSNVKNMQRLQNWLANLRYRSFSGADYMELDVIEKIICIVSDFFYLTNGVWNDEIILFIKSALDNLGIYPYELVSYRDVIYKLASDEVCRKYIFDKNGVVYSSNATYEALIPNSEAVIQGVYVCERAKQLDMAEFSPTYVDTYLEKNYISTQASATAFDIACDLLIAMSKYHNCIDERRKLPAYRDVEKAALLGDIQAKQQYVKILMENDYVEEAYKQMVVLKGIMGDNSEFEILESGAMDSYYGFNDL